MKLSKLFLATLVCCGLTLAADKCGCGASKPKPAVTKPMKEMPKPMPQKSAESRPDEKRPEEAKA